MSDTRLGDFPQLQKRDTDEIRMMATRSIIPDALHRPAVTSSPGERGICKTIATGSGGDASIKMRFWVSAGWSAAFMRFRAFSITKSGDMRRAGTTPRDPQMDRN